MDDTRPISDPRPVTAEGFEIGLEVRSDEARPNVDSAQEGEHVAAEDAEQHEPGRRG